MVIRLHLERGGVEVAAGVSGSGRTVLILIFCLVIRVSMTLVYNSVIGTAVSLYYAWINTIKYQDY